MDAPSASKVADDSGLAIFIAELSAAHKDCKARLTNMETVVNPKSE